MTAWAWIPARGSKDKIWDKNLVKVCGIPLIEYCIRASQNCSDVSRIIVDTDDAEIVYVSLSVGAKVFIHARHPTLTGPDIRVEDCAKDCLDTWPKTPDILVCVQPSNIFTCPGDISYVVKALEREKDFKTAQTVTLIEHNNHSYNQRYIDKENEGVLFREVRNREDCYNKQRKPSLYKFGNVYAIRTDRLFNGWRFWSGPSWPVIIPRPYDHDVDVPFDVSMARAIIRAGLVTLLHMKGHPEWEKRYGKC